MDKKQLFNEALSAIVELAAAQNNTLSLDDIHSAFEGIIDDDSLYEHIFSYLAENKIAIEGYINTDSLAKKTESNDISREISADEDSAPADTSIDENLERAYVDMYMEELKSIPVPDEATICELLPRHFAKDKCATSQLTECMLHNVVNISKEYAGSGVTTADLIQEGNLGLVEGIGSYTDDNEELMELDELTRFSYDKFMAHVNSAIRNAILNAIDEQTNSTRLGRHVADRANALDHAATELAKKLERQPSLAVLAKHLGLSEAEVERVMKMSLDALTIDVEDK